jgi:hypothetical protein
MRQTPATDYPRTKEGNNQLIKNIMPEQTATLDIEAIPISSEQLALARKEKAQVERALERRAQLEQEMLRYKVGLKIIGRDEALALHEHNKFNRNKSKTHIKKLAQFQIDDVWVFNGMSIVLNGANELGIGEVLDGEHRIEAVIESGIPQLFVVVSGVDTDAFETYDTYNKKRTTSDHLFVRGEHNPKVLADALNWLVPRVDTAKAAEAKTSVERRALGQARRLALASKGSLSRTPADPRFCG